MERKLKPAALALLVFSIASAAARADDFGPARTVAQVRSDAHRLLAHRVRVMGVDPKNVTIADVVVAGEQSVLSWDSGKQHGVMGLVRDLDRWWDAFDSETTLGPHFCWTTYSTFPLNPSGPDERLPFAITLLQSGFSRALADAAAAHNADVRAPSPAEPIPLKGSRTLIPSCMGLGYPADKTIRSGGGTLEATPVDASGYAFQIHYAANGAQGALWIQNYGRAPTQAEMLPNPAPPHGWGGPNSVFFFDLAVASQGSVTFADAAMDVWCPFVLDDSLRYDLSFSSDGKYYGPVYATIFDNVLHFQLPVFSMVPRKTLMAEIDGNW